MARHGRLFAYSMPAAIVLSAVVLIASAPARGERLENRVAVFAALDKVTARISLRRIPLDQTDTFGSLKVTPRVCYSRPPDEPPKTITFVEVDEAQLDGQSARRFAGWMFAESPGLHAVEHPVFDVWLIGCEQPVAANAAAAADAARGKTGQRRTGTSPPERARRRVRR